MTSVLINQGIEWTADLFCVKGRLLFKSHCFIIIERDDIFYTLDYEFNRINYNYNYFDTINEVYLHASSGGVMLIKHNNYTSSTKIMPIFNRRIIDGKEIAYEENCGDTHFKRILPGEHPYYAIIAHNGYNSAVEYVLRIPSRGIFLHNLLKRTKKPLEYYDSVMNIGLIGDITQNIFYLIIDLYILGNEYHCITL
jgi:hypothetical protein